MKKIAYLFYAFSLLWLSGCQYLAINKTYQAKGQDSRAQYVIIHYTAANFNRSLALLTTGQVSSHYLLDDSTGNIYQLVDESNRAWHAGLSSWQGRTFLNSSSIGIELVNLGYVDTTQGRKWFGYSDKQIEALILLLKDIKQRHHIAPENILGHSDIAPQRKTDPGPLFPWRRLAKEGLILWPDEQKVMNQTIIYQADAIPNIQWFQQKLGLLGYDTPQTGILDKETQNVISAFQMKYQPEHFTGVPTEKTAALLEVLSNKQFAIPK